MVHLGPVFQSVLAGDKTFITKETFLMSSFRDVQYFHPRYYTEDRDHEMDMWVVLGDTDNKHLTLVVTPYKVSNTSSFFRE